MFKKFLLISALLVLTLPIGLRAVEVNSVGSNLLAEVKPLSPGPGELVTITLSGYGFDLDTSIVKWFVNDRLMVSNAGYKTFKFSLGAVGQQTEVTVFVQTRSGRQMSKTFVFDPAEVELFWEAKTSKPLFYRGKALPSAGATISFVAWPHLVNRTGQKIDPAQLTYRWKKDGLLIENLSGVGKNSALINTRQGDSQVKISVEVISLADNISATKNLVINLVKPEIVFYEKKPLEGVNYGQVLPNEYALFADEVTVRAEPYFLPISSDLLFNYLWTIDRASAESRADDPLALTLRRSQNTSGSNRIGFSAQTKNLTADGSFIIKYGTGLLTPQF